MCFVAYLSSHTKKGLYEIALALGYKHADSHGMARLTQAGHGTYLEG